MTRRPLPEDYVLADEWPLRGVLLAAQKRINDASTPKDQAKQLKSLIRSMLLFCSPVEAFDNLEICELILSFVQDAYRIGMLAGDKEVLDTLRKESSAKGGKRGGQTRAQQAAKTWKPEARELALSLNRAHPEMSRNKIAEEVSKTMISGSQRRGSRTIDSYIKELEASGDLNIQRRRSKK